MISSLKSNKTNRSSFLPPLDAEYLLNSCCCRIYVPSPRFSCCRLKYKWACVQVAFFWGAFFYVHVHVCVCLGGSRKLQTISPSHPTTLMSHLGSLALDCSFSSGCFLIGSLSCETGQLVEILRGSFSNLITALFWLVHHWKWECDIHNVPFVILPVLLQPSISSVCAIKLRISYKMNIK